MLHISRRIALGLGSLSILAIVLANMALQDIYHQEADVALEWALVRVSFLVILVFHVVAIRTLWTDAR
jgi:hypothetical protein